MKKLLLATSFLGLMAAGAEASTVFTLSGIAVVANTGHGLEIATMPRALPYSTPALNVGQSHSFGLFDIWTNETTVNADDTEAQPISVTLTFSAPQPAFVSGALGGLTDGVINNLGWFGTWHQGVVTWNQPSYDVAFGHLGTGLLRISLSNETFNTGLFGLKEGYKYSDTVQARLTLVATPVPEPASLALLGAGLLGLGLARRQRVGRGGVAA